MSAWDNPVAHIRELEAEVERLRKVVARVEALADEWEQLAGQQAHPATRTLGEAADDLRDLIRASE